MLHEHHEHTSISRRSIDSSLPITPIYLKGRGTHVYLQPIESKLTSQFRPIFFFFFFFFYLDQLKVGYLFLYVARSAAFQFLSLHSWFPFLYSMLLSSKKQQNRFIGDILVSISKYSYFLWSLLHEETRIHTRLRED